MKGTITWFDALEEQPPRKHPSTHYSKKILLYLPDSSVVKSRAVWLSDKFAGWEHTDAPYFPTHWAYINDPE